MYDSKFQATIQASIQTFIFKQSQMYHTSNTISIIWFQLYKLVGTWTICYMKFPQANATVFEKQDLAKSREISTPNQQTNWRLSEISLGYHTEGNRSHGLLYFYASCMQE